MGILAIISAALSLASVGTGLWANSIDQEPVVTETRDNDMYGDLNNAGYLEGVSSGIDSTINTTTYMEDPERKQRLQKASSIMGTIGSFGSSIGSMKTSSGKTLGEFTFNDIKGGQS